MIRGSTGHDLDVLSDAGSTGMILDVLSDAGINWSRYRCIE